MEHTLQHPIGLLHLLAALAAVISGAVVIFLPKGTRQHRLWGRAYLLLMFATLLTAFLIYELFQGFGLFHWMGLVSLVTILIGFGAARNRHNPRWKELHAFFMCGSYVGLIAALAAETLTRYVPVPFFAGVGVVSFAVSFVGVYLMIKKIPRLL